MIPPLMLSHYWPFPKSRQYVATVDSTGKMAAPKSGFLLKVRMLQKLEITVAVKPGYTG